jgi:hypothetical protein
MKANRQAVGNQTGVRQAANAEVFCPLARKKNKIKGLCSSNYFLSEPFLTPPLFFYF